MSNQYFNFYYSPARQGFDASTWRTIVGSPAVSNNRLILSTATIVHYADLLRADATFNLNIAAPSAGLSKRFGFYQPGLNAFAYFSISGADFTAECSDGANTTSVSITWQSSWTNTNTEFRVKWEAGTATFFVGGVNQAVIQDVSVSGNPLSLYLTNESDDSLFLNYIDVKTIQSYLMSEGLPASSTFEDLVFAPDQINLTEAVTMLVTTLFVPAAGGNLFDSTSISESVTVERIFDVTVSDSMTLSEAVTMSGQESLSVFDSIETTEAVTVSEPVNTIDLNDGLTITENLVIDME